MMKLLMKNCNLKTIAVINFLIALQFLTGCNNNPGTIKELKEDKVLAVAPANTIIENKANIQAPVLSADSLQKLLKGKWLRSDGTYTIEIFSIKENGVMDAGYFNPNPINVGKSGWSFRDGEIVYEIILKDTNYPGSKYNLIYDKKNDCLVGNYFQAVQGINYDVLFTRIK
jgi:hypothetical protein